MIRALTFSTPAALNHCLAALVVAFATSRSGTIQRDVKTYMSVLLFGLTLTLYQRANARRLGLHVQDCVATGVAGEALLALGPWPVRAESRVSDDQGAIKVCDAGAFDPRVRECSRRQRGVDQQCAPDRPISRVAASEWSAAFGSST